MNSDNSNSLEKVLEDSQQDGVPENSAKEPTESGDHQDPEINSIWTTLPAIPLRKIYSMLCRQDQTNLSMVCRNWYSEFESPDNWRFLHFCFQSQNFQVNPLPVVKFAERFGHLVTDLEFICYRFVYPMVNKNITQFELFVDAIHKRAIIERISFKKLKTFLFGEDYPIRERVFDGIKKILLHQKRIQFVEFINCDLKRLNVIPILKIMFLVSQSPFTTLRIKKVYTRTLFTDPDSGDIADFALWAPTIFNKIEVLDVDYCLFVEDLIACFSAVPVEIWIPLLSNRSSPKKLILWWEKWVMERMEGIPSSAWTAIQQMFPELKVEITINSSADPEVALPILLSASMPLEWLCYKTDVQYLHEGNFTTAAFFNHMMSSNLNVHLKYLRFVWNGDTLTFVENLDTFVRSCPKLKTLLVQVLNPVLRFENLLDSWIANPPRPLEEVDFKVIKIRDEASFAQFIYLNENVIPLLQAVGINFVLSLRKSNEDRDLVNRFLNAHR